MKKNHFSAPRARTINRRNDEAPEELVFACIAFLLLLIAACADLVLKI